MSDFPILASTTQSLPTLPWCVPWEFVAPHEQQAIKNHDQTLKRLAARGGLSWSELDLIIRDQDWDGKVSSNRAVAVANDACAAVRVLAALGEWKAHESARIAAGSRESPPAPAGNP
jgi:hypothetical protein